MPRWVHARRDAEEESESEAESEADEEPEAADDLEEEEAEDEETDAVDEPDEGTSTDPQGSRQQAGPSGLKKQKITVQLGRSNLACHVCGKKGHNAGFVGATYMDCPNRPCYLCKKTGHTTLTCPYRTAPELGCQQAASVSSHSTLAAVHQRERDGRLRRVDTPVRQWQVEVAVLKLHSRRCTTLEFHPSRDNLVLSGDKKGQVAVWDFDKGSEHTVYNLNRALTNNLRFLPGGDGMSCASASSDGTLKVFDIETGLDREVLNLNPGGWIQGVTKEKDWLMLYGLDCVLPRGLLVAGDSAGCLHFVDPREPGALGRQQLHKKGNKVNTVHANPVDPNLLLTASNDWSVRLCDLRNMSSALDPDDKGKGPATAPSALELARMDHPRLVNAAYFSAQTGTKIMTTCIDNRVRVWDYIYSVDRPADREIVHSHDFNRYLSPFRAEWDPKDPNERVIVVGRYISENLGGLALHPVDLLDAATGRHLAQLVDPNLATICPVNKPHPRREVIVSGSSRSLFAWMPESPDAEEEGGRAAARSDAAAVEMLVRGSANFVFFDAEGAADDGKKKKRAAGDKAKKPTPPENGKKRKK